MQDYSDNNRNNNRQNQRPNSANPNRSVRREPDGAGRRPQQGINARPRQNAQPRPMRGTQPYNRDSGEARTRGGSSGQGMQRPRPADGQARQGSGARPQRAPEVSGQRPPQRAPKAPSGQRPPQRVGSGSRKNPNPGIKAKRRLTPHEAAKKKRRKIIFFVAEIFVLLILVGVLWVVNKSNKMTHVKIEREDVVMNPGIADPEGNVAEKLQGYRNIALFGVDSRSGELDKSTRTDTIIIASIDLDTKKVRLVSVYRDTWLNMSNDSYNKANAAYAKGGPKQAISMLNMNLDMDITDYVTIGFDGLIDVIDAVGGVEIDVKEKEISYLNDYQISMVGKPDGTLNAAGEPNYTAVAGVEYAPVKRAGLQTLNGTQATAYARIRYVGDDFERTARQRTVMVQAAKKAVTLNPVTLNKIADAIFPKVSTSLELSEILSLLSGIASYEITETSGFPFEGYVRTGRVKKASVVIPVDLEKNVSLLHEYLFNDASYEPTDTVKKCSEKIASDTGVSYSGE